MKHRLKIFILIALSLFLLNSCELLNPFNDDKNTIIVPDSKILVSIQRTHNSIQGQIETVEIIMENSEFSIGGFDLLITYDASALSFQSADEGQFLIDCGWGYFTYRFNYTIIDSNTIRHTIRINALANVGHIPPTCYIPNDSTSNQLAVLNFLITNDRTFECELAPIQFYWEDCGDNMIADYYGNQLFVSKNIYNKTDTNKVDYSINLNENIPYPSIAGYNSSCDTLIPDNNSKPIPIQNIDFINGGIDIACADSIDKRGDLNLNDITFEIADIVLYANYFIYGNSVFTVNKASQIAASDVNADGLPLTLADFVYGIRIIVGDALPYPNTTINNPEYIEGYYQRNTSGDILILNGLNISAAKIVVEGEVQPSLLASEMSIMYNFDSTNTTILVYSLENKNFTDKMINIGNTKIISIEMADYQGTQVNILKVE